MPMKKSHFTEEQIAYALRQAETGTAVCSRGRTERRPMNPDLSLPDWMNNWGTLTAGGLCL